MADENDGDDLEVIEVREGGDDGGDAGDPVEELRRQVEAARAEAAAARREAAQVRASNNIENALLSASSEAAAARSDWAAKMEAGDFESAATAQVRLTDAEQRRARLAQQAEAAQRAPVSGDAFEDHLTKFTAPTANWMRQHKDWVTDPRKSAKLVGAHHMALGDGLEPDSPSYFAHVERTLGLDGSTNGGGNGSRTTGRRSTSPPVAPVSGSAGGHSSGSSNRGVLTVTLTKGEKESATDGTHVWGRHDLAAGRIKDASMIGRPIGIVEMARRVHSMKADGRYD